MPKSQEVQSQVQSPLQSHLEAASLPRIRSALLATREETHGTFHSNARISQFLKTYFRRESRGIPAIQAEALDMIALKLSRILSGNADISDHWLDIAGYASLVVESLTTEPTNE